MIRLSTYGKRVMATVALIITMTVLTAMFILVVTDNARHLHVNQMLFNMVYITIVLPVCSWIIVSMICIIRHGRLL